MVWIFSVLRSSVVFEKNISDDILYTISETILHSAYWLIKTFFVFLPWTKFTLQHVCPRKCIFLLCDMLRKFHLGILHRRNVFLVLCLCHVIRKDNHSLATIKRLSQPEQTLKLHFMETQEGLLEWNKIMNWF